MQLNMNDEQLKSIISGAIFNAMDQATKEKLFKEALQYLLTDKKDAWGQQLSPIKEIFNLQCERLARDILKKELETNEIMHQEIRQVLLEAFDKIFAIENREKLIDKIASAFYEIFK